MILDNTDESFIVINKELTIIAANKIALEKSASVLGKPLVNGQSILTYAEPERIGYLKPLYAEVFNGKKINDTIEIKSKEHQKLYYSVTYTPVFDKPGEVIAAVITTRDITEEKKKEEGNRNLLLLTEGLKIKYEKESNYFNSTLEQLADGFASFDKEGNIVYINSNGAELLRVKKGQVLNTNIFSVIPETESNGFRNLFQQVVTENKSGTLKLYHPGWQCWIHYRMYPTENGVTVFFRDISALQQARTALKDSEERYKYLFYMNPLPMWIGDIDTRQFLEVNEAAIRHYGYSREEFLSMTINDIRPEEDIEKLNHVVRTEYGKISLYNGQWRHIKKDGQLIHVEITSHLIDYNNKKASLVLVNDITEKVKARQELLQSNERFDYASRATFDAIWDWDLEKQVCYRGEGYEELFGHRVDNTYLDGALWNKYIHPDDKERVTENFSNVINSRGTTKWYDEYRYLKAGGDYAYVADRGTILRNPEGKAYRIIGAIRDITAQKNYELQLEGSNNEIRTILESITDGFFTVDKEWVVQYWNKEAERMLHVKREEIIGKNLWEVFSNVIPLKFYNEYHRAVNENTAVHFKEYFPLLKMWFDVSGYPSEKGLSVYFKDVTQTQRLIELERLEKEVLEMNAVPENKLEEILDFYLKEIEKIHEGMLCSILRLENNRIYNWSSPSLPERFRNAIDGEPIGENAGSCGTAAYRKEKVIVTDIEHDPLWANYKTLALNEGLKACWSFPIENSKKKLLGTFAIYYTEPKEPTREDENTIERARNILLIILENKMAEETIRLSNERYDLVAKATNDAIWDWNVQTGEVVRTGNGLQVLFGYDPQEASSDNNFWMNKVHPADIERVVNKRGEIFKNPQEDYWEDEYRFLKSDGTYAYVYDKGYIIRDEHGEVVRVIGATQDITGRKENEIILKELNEKLEKRARELLESNAELERFAYVASHDLQEPLRMVSSFLQILKKKFHNQLDETANQYIHFAVDGADRMKKLINDLLEYSRIGSNKEVFETIHVKEIINSVLNIYSNRIKEKKALIKIEEMPVIEGAKTQIAQLFQNLIGNALKYCNKHKPQITVSYIESTDTWTFSVKDNGIGIDKKYWDKIFIIFQRLHNKTEYSGTGIGLSICKKIVERHGGEIWVESEVNKGSTFYFTIKKSLV